MKRGEVWWYEPPNAKRRPVLILTRDEAISRVRDVIAEPVVLHTARHLTDHIDILRRPRRGSARLGDPQMNRGTANENDFIEQRSEERCRGL